jgi:hypothetical protein
MSCLSLTCPWGQRKPDLSKIHVDVVERKWIIDAVTSNYKTAAMIANTYNLNVRTIQKWVIRARDGNTMRDGVGRPPVFNEKAKEIMKDWPGVLNAEKAADFVKGFSGAHRSAIVKYMEMAPFQKAGFPSVGVTRAAITDPDILGAAGNLMGHHVVELHPDKYDPEQLAFEHSTYPVPTKGELVGRLPMVERHVAMPDYTEKQVMDPAVLKTGEKAGQPLIIHPYSPNPLGRASYRGNTEMRQAIQPINERMLESIQEKHGSDFARGGSAKGREFGHHPVHGIPGVHIVTAEAGEPVFTGEK